MAIINDDKLYLYVLIKETGEYSDFVKNNVGFYDNLSDAIFGLLSFYRIGYNTNDKVDGELNLNTYDSTRRKWYYKFNIPDNDLYIERVEKNKLIRGDKKKFNHLIENPEGRIIYMYLEGEIIKYKYIAGFRNPYFEGTLAEYHEYQSQETNKLDQSSKPYHYDQNAYLIKDHDFRIDNLPFLTDFKTGVDGVIVEPSTEDSSDEDSFNYN